MQKTVSASALLVSITSFYAGCSSDEASSSGGGGSGGAGAVAGASVGGSSGAASGSGGTSGTAGTTSGGGSSGASGASGSAGSGGSDTGGASGSGGDAGSGMTGGAGGAGAGGGGVGGAGAGGAGGAGGGGKAGAGAGGAGAGGAGAGGAGAGGAGKGGAGAGGGANAMMNFFVTSDTSSMNGNLGGLMMADMRCQTLAAAVGHGSKTWRAYLSVMNPPTNARDRIGDGPYYNSAGALLAADKAALHTRSGDAALFIDERGNRINGQWAGTPSPNQHDILTGSSRDGMLAMNQTCSDWTATTGQVQVGHSDGLGPNMSMEMQYPYWSGSHTSQCGNLAQSGGAGKLYCFVAP